MEIKVCDKCGERDTQEIIFKTEYVKTVDLCFDCAVSLLQGLINVYMWKEDVGRWIDVVLARGKK